MNPIDRIIALSQLFMLGAWEALGTFAFGWNGWYVLAVWVVGLWSFNILTATAVRTFFKLTAPPPDDESGAMPIIDAEEDFGG